MAAQVTQENRSISEAWSALSFSSSSLHDLKRVAILSILATPRRSGSRSKDEGRRLYFSFSLFSMFLLSSPLPYHTHGHLLTLVLGHYQIHVKKWSRIGEL